MQNIRLFSPAEDRFTGKVAEISFADKTDRIYFLLSKQASDSEVLTTYQLTSVTDDLYELIFFYMGMTHVMLLDLQKESYQDTLIQMDHMRDHQKGTFRFL